MTTTGADAAYRIVTALDALAVGPSVIAEGATAWHNFDGVDMSLLDAQESLRTIRAVVPDFRFTDVRTTATGEDGVALARFTYRATLPDGGEVTAHACLVVHSGPDGRVTRIEEYLDTGQLAPVLALLG